MYLGKVFEYVCDLIVLLESILCAVANVRRYEFHTFAGMGVTGEITVESLKDIKIVHGRAVWMEE